MDKRIRRHVIGRIRDYFAVTSPGVESICRQELTGLGLDCRASSADSGGVPFKGRFVDCQRANLYLRTATRVLMRVDTFTATNPGQLTRLCAAIPWELFLVPGPLPRINAASRRSRLFHTDLVADSVRAGVVARLGPPGEPGGSEAPQSLYVRLAEDRVTLSLDSSGAPLFKRGLKPGPARAPLRETLAAAMLMAAGYDGRRPLVDPMCGSGTVSLEAAMMAKQMAPGVRRRFAFMEWPAFRGNQWAHLKHAAKAAEQCLERPLIFASDIDARAGDHLSEHIDANGLADAVSVVRKDFFRCAGSDYANGPGLVAINPPYGVRLGSATAAEDLFNRICSHLKAAFGGWDVALIAPAKRLVKAIPFPVRQMPLVHGGLRVTLCLGKCRS